MYQSIASTYIVALIFMIALRPLAKSIGLVDVPSGRKSHSGDVPLIGGIAIFLGIAAGLFLLPGNDPSLFYLNRPQLARSRFRSKVFTDSGGILRSGHVIHW